MHNAALRYGQGSTMFQEIMRGELLANGDDTRLRTLPDELGIPPLGYDDTATAMSKVRWRSMPQHSSPAPFNPVTCFFFPYFKGRG